MSTISNLGTYVDASTYQELEEGTGYSRYKNMLNGHLQGERGASALSLLWNPAGFKPEEVKMGLTASCPMPLRQQIVAQHNYRANEMRHKAGKNPASTDSIRVTNLMSATLGMALSLVYRVTRTALRTIFSPVTFLYSLFVATRANERRRKSCFKLSRSKNI